MTRCLSPMRLREVFTDQLESEEGRAIGLSYFWSRVTVMMSSKNFSSVIPLTSDALIKAADEGGHNLEFFEKLGLVKEKENGDRFDFFRGRVMFPIPTT